MKKFFYLIGLSFIALACGKDGTSSIEQPEDLPKYMLESTVDPVIDYYSQFGTVEKMSSSYSGQSDNVCSNHAAIYRFVPRSGPYQGLTCEIYRFNKSSDISGPCDDTYNLEKAEGTIGNAKYVHCPDDGDNCKELDMPWGCSLVFCDDDDDVQ